MRKTNQRMIAEADRLTLEVLARAQSALREAGGAPPRRRRAPRRAAACALPVRREPSAWAALVAGQGEILLITCCLALCLFEVLRG